MPILTIEIVLRPGEALPSHLAADIADRAGQVFGSPPGQTWVKLRGIPAGQYAENGDVAEEVFPVFVSVLKGKRPPPDELQTEVTQLATAIAQASARPVENVHLVYEPEGAGRVAFGGNLVST